MRQNQEHELGGCMSVAKAEFEGFLQLTAFKGLQFVKHSAHWTESVFWIVFLIGATVLAIRDIRKTCEDFANEETHTSMSVKGYQKLTFADAIICVDYDPRALNLANPQLAFHAQQSSLRELAKQANLSAVGFLNRALKLLTAISLIEHGRSCDFQAKLDELQRSDDLQQLQDWLRTQKVDISDIARNVGNWLCNSLQVHIDTISRGRLLRVVNPCKSEKITWLGVFPFATYTISETAVCVDVGGEISFESIFDRVVINLHTAHLFQHPSANNQSEDYFLNAYLDFTGDPVSTDMTKDFITFPESGCESFDIGMDAKLRLLDRSVARCNTTADTRFACYAGCDMQRYANTRLRNCTQLAWGYHYANRSTMCFDVATLQEHLDGRRLSPSTNVSGDCCTSCFFPCEYRQYGIAMNHAGCYKDNPNQLAGGFSVELNPKRFTVPIFEEHFEVGVSNLFSRLGGTCGIWLGVGLLGICHVLLFPLKLLMRLLIRVRCLKHGSVPAVVELS